MPCRTETFDVFETSHGWTCGERHYRTAVEAFNAITQAAQQDVDDDGVLVTLINWHPATTIGQIVTSVLASTQEKMSNAQRT